MCSQSYLKGGRYLRCDLQSHNGCEVCFAGEDLMRRQRILIRSLAADMEAYGGKDISWFNRKYLEYAAIWNRAVRECPEVMDPVLDYFEDNGTAYLVTKFTDTPLDLSRETRSEIRLRKGEAVLAAGAAALEAMHRQGLLLLRFDGEENFYEDTRGNIRLGFVFASEQLEWSLVKPRDAWMSGRYAAPEVYLKKPLVPTADVYALSALVYAIITGMKPEKSLFRFYEKRELPDCNTIDRHSFRSLAWGLSLDPKDRPQSVRQLADSFLRKL